MAHSTLNRTSTTPTRPHASERDDEHGRRSAVAQTRHSVGQNSHLALAERRPRPSFTDDQGGWPLAFARLSPLDPAEMEQAKAACVQSGAQATARVSDALDQRSRAGLVAATGRVHQVARRRMDVQHRQRLLRRLPVLALNLAIRWGSRLSPSGESVRADVQGLARLETRRWKLARVGDGRHVWSVLKARSGEPKAALACPVSSCAATADDTASRSDNSTVNA